MLTSCLLVQYSACFYIETWLIPATNSESVASLLEARQSLVVVCRFSVDEGSSVQPGRTGKRSSPQSNP